MKSIVYIYFLSCLCIFAGFGRSLAETKEAQAEFLSTTPSAFCINDVGRRVCSDSYL